MAEKKATTTKKEDVKEVKKTAPAKVAVKPAVKAESAEAAPKAAAKVEVKAESKAKEAPAVKAQESAKPAPKAEAKEAAKPVVKAIEAKAKKEKGKAPYVSSGELRVELTSGLQGLTKRQIRTIQALGLKKIGSFKIHKDNPAIQGMVKLVAHLVRVEKVKKD